jgi:hypothetical protein
MAFVDPRLILLNTCVKFSIFAIFLSFKKINSSQITYFFSYIENNIFFLTLKLIFLSGWQQNMGNKTSAYYLTELELVQLEYL